MRDKFEKVLWKTAGPDQWAAKEKTHRATVTFVPPGTYTLKIVGSGAPEDKEYPTRGLAKEAFRQFMKSTTKAKAA